MQKDNIAVLLSILEPLLINNENVERGMELDLIESIGDLLTLNEE